MRNFFCLILVLIVFINQSHAQLCEGSLGDPVVNIDFGAGTNPGPQSSFNTTSYSFISDDCPNDGFYTVRNKTSNCFGASWHTLSQDHTGNPNGYFMLVNASFEPGDFYVTTVRGLCPNTTFEFAAWVVNVLRTSACGTGAIKPNLTFSIETPAGTMLASLQTGDISSDNQPTWKQYGAFFKTPSSSTDVVVRIRNNAPGGCGNDLALDDITFRPCGPKVSAAINGIDSSNTINVCADDTTTFFMKANVSEGYNDPAYQWERSTDGTNWTDIAGASTNSLSFKSTGAGSYRYRLAVAETGNINSGNCRILSNILAFNVNAQPVIALSANKPVCEGRTLIINAHGGTTYKWQGPNNWSSADSTIYIPDVPFGAAGKYAVLVTTDKGCRLSDSVIISINPSPVALASNDTLICEGSSVQLTANGGDAYNWIPATALSAANIPNPVASPADTTTYTLIVTNTYGCSDSDDVVINVYKKPLANAGPDKAILEGDNVTINGTISGTLVDYSWSPLAYISGGNTLQPVVNPPHDTTYFLRVESKVGCGIATDDVFIRVYKKVMVPNAFSPNNDGINDTWSIAALETYPSADVLVFNRYGQAVFTERGYNKPWNGTFNEKPLPVGTYYYIIDLKVNLLQKIKGWVMILK